MATRNIKKTSEHIFSRNRAAFTLNEIAIVLGVIGTILGVIWGVTSKVYSNQKTVLATQEVLTLAESMRSTYGPKNAVDNGDLTQYAVNNGMYSPDMLQSISCSNSGSAVAPCPIHPWNGEMVVGGGSYLCTGCTTNAFTIALFGLTNTQCVTFLATFVPQAVQHGFYAINYAGIGSTAIDNTTPVSSSVIQNCAGTLILQFKLQ
jgi:hypothetical protein